MSRPHPRPNRTFRKQTLAVGMGSQDEAQIGARSLCTPKLRIVEQIKGFAILSQRRALEGVYKYGQCPQSKTGQQQSMDSVRTSFSP